MATSYDNTNYELQEQLDLLNIHAITNKGAAYASGLYKITTNTEGHITAAVAVAKSDITALGIPAQDTVYTLPKMTDSVLGGGKTGYTTAGKNYAVSIDSDGNLYVNVPWTDNDTTYSAGTGISISNSNAISLSTSGVTAGSYGQSAAVTGTDGATVSIPYITVDSYGRITSISNKTYTASDKNTTYSTATSSAYGLVKIGYTASGKNYPVELSDGKMYVNVPWSDTVYTHPTTSGNKHIPSGGSTGQFLGWDSAGTAKWVNNPNTNTTYTIATGDSNGQIKVTPSGGTAYNVSVKGLGTAAYTASTAYAAASHGNHIPSGGSSGQFLGWSSSGAAKWVSNPNTDHYAWSDITSKPATATRWPSWSEVTSKPVACGRIDTGSSSTGTYGGLSGYYQDVSFGVTISNARVVASHYNSNTSVYGPLGDPVIISNISTSGCRIWTTHKLQGYYVDWIAMG